MTSFMHVEYHPQSGSLGTLGGKEMKSYCLQPGRDQTTRTIVLKTAMFISGTQSCPMWLWAASVTEVLLESLSGKLTPWATRVLKHLPASLVSMADISVPWWTLLQPSCCQTLRTSGSLRCFYISYVPCLALFQVTLLHAKTILQNPLGKAAGDFYIFNQYIHTQPTFPLQFWSLGEKQGCPVWAEPCNFCLRNSR